MGTIFGERTRYLRQGQSDLSFPDSYVRFACVRFFPTIRFASESQLPAKYLGIPTLSCRNPASSCVDVSESIMEYSSLNLFLRTTQHMFCLDFTVRCFLVMGFFLFFVADRHLKRIRYVEMLETRTGKHHQIKREQAGFNVFRYGNGVTESKVTGVEVDGTDDSVKVER
ncbi:hypothetical protein SODALDRAFT_13977 [Sodiomyces alkalinus F11]|uniref:Uncharacterized protein n=1 Tax=Sodiomyces alkalinus (strain CBS 110278 / VKM F-3762 / F11) TaxID=1314773 RepID=A0A3N2Q6U1_SODAK|nr:hypothetical protein SODALDRAFT_13977 [Sodiomyces alkalinus F11]ROT42378.1 hypothetical protein SODALDRAFT_13977 [Sodiomyces alkalinus F11]